MELPEPSRRGFALYQYVRILPEYLARGWNLSVR
jgi:hypothetical protein